MQRGYTVNGSDPATVIDKVAAAIARDLGAETPTRSVATIRTASPAAYALYQRGLQVMYRGDPMTAHTLMRAAWELDTTFAMAAFHGWMASGIRKPFIRDDALLEAARRLAPRAIDRNGCSSSTVSGRDSAPTTSIAIAETLAVRYPEYPEGHFALGSALEVWETTPRHRRVRTRGRNRLHGGRSLRSLLPAVQYARPNEHCLHVVGFGRGSASDGRRIRTLRRGVWGWVAMASRSSGWAGARKPRRLSTPAKYTASPPTSPAK